MNNDHLPKCICPECRKEPKKSWSTKHALWQWLLIAYQEDLYPRFVAETALKLEQAVEQKDNDQAWHLLTETSCAFFERCEYDARQILSHCPKLWRTVALECLRKMTGETYVRLNWEFIVVRSGMNIKSKG